MYFQITFDSDVIKSFFEYIWLSILAFGINHLITKRRKKIITIWLQKKELKYDRIYRKQRAEQISRMFGNANHGAN